MRDILAADLPARGSDGMAVIEHGEGPVIAIAQAGQINTGALGRDGIAEMIARHCRIARQMAEALAAEPGIAILNRVELNQLAVRFGSDRSDEVGDALTAKVIDALPADGTCFAGGARWKGQWIMPLSVISWSATEEDADRSVEAIIRIWRSVRDAGSAAEA